MFPWHALATNKCRCVRPRSEALPQRTRSTRWQTQPSTSLPCAIVRLPSLPPPTPTLTTVAAAVPFASFTAYILPFASPPKTPTATFIPLGKGCRWAERLDAEALRRRLDADARDTEPDEDREAGQKSIHALLLEVPEKKAPQPGRDGAPFRKWKRTVERRAPPKNGTHRSGGPEGVGTPYQKCARDTHSPD